MIEVWKDIPNYEGIYQASNLGRIRSCENKITHTNKHGDRHWKQRIIKPKYTQRGDGRVSLWKDGKQKDWLVSRLIGITFLGQSNLTINHIDGNPKNNNVLNLEWVSITENIRKGFDLGLYSNCIKVKIISKTNNNELSFRSLAQASKYMGFNDGYLSGKIKRNIFENQTYRWQYE